MAREIMFNAFRMNCVGRQSPGLWAHETFSDIPEHLVPELQKRGRYKRDYATGTLREKLFGVGPRLSETHIGARYRNLASSRPTLDAAE
jgi:long-chain alkane monooxygenase